MTPAPRCLGNDQIQHIVQPAPLITTAIVKEYMILTLITGTVRPMPIHKNRLASSRSTVDRMWSSISIKIGSNSIKHAIGWEQGGLPTSIAVREKKTIHTHTPAAMDGSRLEVSCVDRWMKAVQPSCSARTIEDNSHQGQISPAAYSSVT